tara:strand:+ start:497 stop:670 length:174 start_codon:yes stop_codon:yes gene_type:complete
MNITSAKYNSYKGVQQNEAIIAVIDGKTVVVPTNPANRHYQAILEWVADGNTIAEAD